jgi:hypothetical protein
MVNHPNRHKAKRTSESLRDVLFNEIEELQTEKANPTKSMAVANLAKQIINIAKVEIDFHQAIVAQAQEGHPLSLGKMQLGSDGAAYAEPTATAA